MGNNKKPTNFSVFHSAERNPVANTCSLTLRYALFTEPWRLGGTPVDGTLEGLPVLGRGASGKLASAYFPSPVYIIEKASVLFQNT